MKENNTWEYSPYRAALLLNGEIFAIVSRDGKTSLTPEEQEILLKALNKTKSETP